MVSVAWRRFHPPFVTHLGAAGECPEAQKRRKFVAQVRPGCHGRLHQAHPHLRIGLMFVETGCQVRRMEAGGIESYGNLV